MLRYQIYSIVTHPRFPYYSYRVSILLFIASIYLLANPTLLTQKAFISENALSPNLQKSSIGRADISTWENYSDLEILEDIHAKEWPSVPGVYYTLLRGSRNSGTDCLAFTAPFREGNNENLKTMADFVRYMNKEHSWLGNNLLFIFYRDDEPFIGRFRAWLDSYMTGKELYFGEIRAAFGIDLDTSFSYATVLSDGINGIQTDVDMLVTMLKLFPKEVKLPLFYPIPYKEYLPYPIDKLSYTLSSWISIMKGWPHHPHSYFLSSGILSVTIATDSQPGLSLNNNRLQFLRLLELTAKTFSGLEEQLHAGYYFYYFPDQWTMMPLGRYAFILVAMALPLLCQSILIFQHRSFDPKALGLLVSPYIISALAIILTRLQNISCDHHELKENYWWIFVLVSFYLPRFYYQKADRQIFHAYSNIALGLSLVILGLIFFPFAVVAGLSCIPCKLLMLQHRKISRGLLLIVIFSVAASGVLWGGLNEWLEVEICSGHKIWTAFVIGYMPNLLHFIYLIL